MFFILSIESEIVNYYHTVGCSLLRFCKSTGISKTRICNIVFEGDYLSFERAMGVIGSQGDGRNKSERIDHLIPVMADFHVQMNFLKLIWKHLYKVWLYEIDRVD